MTTELPQIQKFNGDNFHLWKFQMKIILEAKDLLSITDGSEVKPEIEDIAKFSNWKKKDAKSKMLITTALEFKYLQQIVNCQTSAEMWKKLSTIYELKSETNKYLLQQRFFEYKMNPNDNIATHISKVETLAQQMKDLGEPISDVALITKIICSLPDKYKNFITAWDSVSSEEKTLENLTARLLKEESLQDHWDSSGNSKPDNALMTFSKFNRNSTASNKQQQHQQSIKDKKKNTHCGYCKKKGHWWKECYKRKEEQKGQQPSSSSRDDSCAFSAETSAFLAETKDSWIADSGATDHMTFRREWFSTFEEIPEGVHPVCLGDGKKIYAKGKGNIDILSYVDSQKINATLLDVLYVPELETNLFSISTATKHGLTLICKGNQIKLTKNSKVLVTGIKDNSNLYRIFIKAKQSSQTHVAQLSLDIWHQRMGHVNPIKLTQMFENNVFEDDIKIREKPDSLLCEACIYGKQNRKVFHASTSPNSTYPGELIYSDVCGPMSKRSPGGSLYFVSFKDDFSRFRMAYFIRHKSDVLEKFKEFVKRVRTETGNKIKRFRTDNGTEFLNKNFSDYLKSLGIVHELTAPYTPEQNGIAERDNRTIVESARCLLHGRKMPLELWAEAVNTAVYLLNRCTTKVLGNSTPYEIWYKRKPSILHLKTFGCNAYVHIPKDNRKKLDKKSIRTFFVGYTETNKNYRMWDPIARKIIISRDVIFTEANTSENIQDNQQEQVTIYSEESVDNTNTSSKPEESCRYPLRNRIRENEQTSTSCTRAISYACYVHDQEPLNYEDAIVGQNSKQWKLAMDDEFNSLMKNQTWTYVTLPSDRKAIACKWVYKIKQNADGSNKMFKARLVAKGYSQKPGLDYGETFSPVVKFDSIRTILSLCASLDMEMIQLDVKSAFLNGDLEEELYMEQPQGYENPDFPNHVCSLQKSIYGLKQSPRMWNKKFHEFLIKFDLKPSISDSCVYTMKCKQAYILLAIYVDDCLICSVNKQHLDDIVQYLNSNFEIKTFTADYFLGLQIYRDRTTKMLFLHQASYIERTLEHYNLLDIKLQSVPSDPYSKLTKEMCPKDDQEIEEMNKIPYRQTIGSLMYLMTGTRPDIAYAVSRVSQFMNNPGPSHWTAVKKIFGYLKATKNIGICFGGSSCTTSLIGFSDADFGGDLDTRKSTTGYVFMLNNGPISWCSQKQNCVSLSTTESEYIAASKATKEAIWLRHLLRELHQEQVKPTTIFCDNQSCIRLVHNPEYHKRTKHIDISYHFIRDHFQNHAIDLLYVCSNDQAADIFTKALPPERFRRLRSQLGLFETTECTLGYQEYKTPDILSCPGSPSRYPEAVNKFEKGKRFDSDEDVKKVVQDFFHTLPKRAYKEGIYKLPERCRRCIESQDTFYFTQCEIRKKKKSNKVTNLSPDHPVSRRATCAACGSSDGSLTHRYWNCRDVRPLLREVFASCEVPLDLQAWLFGVGLHPEAMQFTSVAKATIYKYHLGLEVLAGVAHLKTKMVLVDGSLRHTCDLNTLGIEADAEEPGLQIQGHFAGGEHLPEQFQSQSLSFYYREEIVSPSNREDEYLTSEQSDTEARLFESVNYIIEQSGVSVKGWSKPLVFDRYDPEPVKVDRMTEDNGKQRMTEVRDDYVADALTNIQPHCEDRVSHLKDAMRGLAAPRIEKVISAPIDISCATNISPHRLEQADEIHREILTLPRQPASTMSHGNHRKKYHQASSQPTPQDPFKTSIW
ncbi:hypothetical protein LAZ67_20002749 [Cordylochernes scorpioides]|uniref:Integrase catalytic domain-containing protein n=1 Tax=Cordylochernes scorpioides TaxID=51811 RepID=A0ABY6LNF5_9ARAC|nr:hypothetical protein LAZ67_20002749 [Cordylochernes scorpioides]